MNRITTQLVTVPRSLAPDDPRDLKQSVILIESSSSWTVHHGDTPILCNPLKV
jgi:hypothetical protein